ncbi:MAG: hypothetical protein M0T70_18480 [Geobacteraceae bacterium]|nr:hypothetical protein [Geobacteraceae bacterium]
MHVVVIHGWKEETTELIQALAGTVGITPYEMRQRMIGGGPAVVANFADPHAALTMAAKLDQSGVATAVIDADAVPSLASCFVVRRFEMNEQAVRIESGDGRCAEIAYEDIDLLLSGTRIRGESKSITVTERKLSLGKTLLSGGIPMTKKVEHQEQVSTEERDTILCLYAGDRPTAVFSQSGLLYDGHGAGMKLTRELNFAHLKSELRRHCPAARCDDRLLNRLGPVRILGPAQNPETNLDLAFAILARTLRSGHH